MDAGSSNSTAPGPLLSADYTAEYKANACEILTGSCKAYYCANAFCVILAH